ncbi:hypothetical protein Poli38472_009492 [Pythium oligandrum]|uniref:Ankyrin n=1 Tax=Pythium oligandrum TaxID=41045 RepID=A0A8K1CFB6_PYTOL|nr:hypothetical protein Poli38472_009492 [Pythium oligandrum]|eukprot:TMW61999.1 hypothetical protein Poli38472_009492 [Pythium oligandrum]
MSSGERGSNSTPLTLAIDHGAEEIVDLFLARGADVNKSSAYGHSPLSCAAKEGLVSIVQRLLHEGADPTHFHPEREPSPMKGAVLARSLPIMKLLLDHGAKVDAVDTFDLYEFRGTPLDVAVMENLFEEAELLVKEGHADVNFTWGNNKTQVICHAAGRGNVEMMAPLLDHGADVNGGDADYSPLYNAASSGHLAATQWLVEHGADVERLTSNADLFKYCVIEAERHGKMAAVVEYLKALKTESQTELMDTSMDAHE